MSQIITINAQPSAVLTMSSLEIARLVESRHDNVKITIERLAERGVITLPAMQEVPNPSFGPKSVKAYMVGKRDTYVVVAQLSPEFTARLVDRWQELEVQARSTPITPALPDFSNPAIAARAWAEQYEQAEEQAAGSQGCLIDFPLITDRKRRSITRH
ncbi:Rha family transcriptional regulator [Rhizobium sp. ARZ01]|uniref:Rha family transcriptional regulator n=1 Tax=Rhizobium sp. ARZ01 TaxID=2769313 RepID=UPI001781E7A0|nr:Rha family transcriptional regulator [Rhizobium sp. ARZ01]MBD9373203.1 Rha family transcriptional regulator [Rhizobium sp. ARZ01]